MRIVLTIFLEPKNVSGGAEPKAETASNDEMSKISKNPSNDLPNQEKNQY